MLLTITLTNPPATDLGYLLHKNPSRVHTRSLSFGSAHVFYPEATDERCTAALLLDIDPVGLVRGRRPGPSLEPYVNDRPYVASSFLSSAIAEHFGTAMTGRSKERQELADTALPFEVGIPVLPARGGEGVTKRLFEPLGYTVLDAARQPLSAAFAEWGSAPYLSARMSTTTRLRDLLSHLYVLIPVLDDQKHYWVDQAEIDKLLRRGEGWLPTHPERELITRRYLARQHNLTREALRRLAEDVVEDPDREEEQRDAEEAVVEERVSLHEQRIGAVLAALRAEGAKRVVDLGCGEGRLLAALVKDFAFTEILGVDVSARSLENAARRLRLERMNERQRERLRLLHGSLMYRDERLGGFDAGVLMEVIEHVPPNRMPALERAVFEFARPTHVVVTTPNVEYNIRFEGLPAGKFRHRDHRFEWTRSEFEVWAARVADRFGFAVRYLPIGPDDPEVGPPTQMAVFSR